MKKALLLIPTLILTSSFTSNNFNYAFKPEINIKKINEIASDPNTLILNYSVSPINYELISNIIFAPDESSENDNDEWKINKDANDYVEVSEITEDTITIHKKQGFASQIILQLYVKEKPSINTQILIDCNPIESSNVLSFDSNYEKVNIAYINYNESVTFDNTTSYIDESGLFTNEVDFENVKLEFGYSINSINPDLIPEEYYNPTLRYIGGKDFIDLFSGTNLYNDEYFKLATDNVKLSDFLNTQSNNGLTLLNGGVIDTNFLEEIFANSTNFNQVKEDYGYYQEYFIEVFNNQIYRYYQYIFETSELACMVSDGSSHNVHNLDSIINSQGEALEISFSIFGGI